MTKSKPIQISPELAARCDGNDQAERMDKLLRAVIVVPRAEIADRESRWKQRQAKKKAQKEP